MALRVSDEEFRVYLTKMGRTVIDRLSAPPPKPSKYRNQRVTIDGENFASKGEAQRWQELRTMQAAGLIADLKRQVRFTIHINGYDICAYIADFVYFERGERVVEDFKGFRTEVFTLKKKLLYALYQIEIKEVTKRK